MPKLSPILDREEYIEQAYFFETFRARLQQGLVAQEVLSRVHEEILSITKLPLAIQFLATEMKHTGLLGKALERITHYFTPFQAMIIGKSEEEGLRFSIDTALQVLQFEAQYRSETPTRAGLFVYEFETLCRNRLGYDDGLDAMGLDGFYDEAWRDYIESVRMNIGEVEFADLVYLRSEEYAKEHRRKTPEKELPPVLFGEKEGKIARANRGRDPLFLFAALQRQLNYPKVPFQVSKENPFAAIPTLLAKARELEQRVKQLEMTERDRMADVQKLKLAPENIHPVDLDE